MEKVTRPTEWVLERCEQDGDCLLWARTCDRNGVPRISVKGEDKSRTITLQLRRVMWENQHGPIPQGMKVSVTCGNPRCLEHLTLKTSQQVIRDLSNRPDVRARKVVAGYQTRTRSTFSMEKARYVRTSPKTLQQVADELGISLSSAGKIRRGEMWAEVNPFAGLF
jgi:hypothetical protein